MDAILLREEAVSPWRFIHWSELEDDCKVLPLTSGIWNKDTKPETTYDFSRPQKRSECDSSEKIIRLALKRFDRVLNPEAGALAQEFEERATRWENESAVHSSPAAQFLHKDYQSIIGKGPAVVPLILKRLSRSGADWLWALEHITGENPAEGIDKYDDAVKAWLDWGKERFSIDDEMPAPRIAF